MQVNINHLKSILVEVKSEVLPTDQKNGKYRLSLKGVSKLVGISKDYYSKIIRSKIGDDQSQYPLMRHLLGKGYKRREINKWAREGTPIVAVEYIVEYYAQLAPINHQRSLAQIVYQEGNACRLIGRFTGLPVGQDKRSQSDHPEAQEDVLWMIKKYTDLKKHRERIMENYRNNLEQSEELYNQIKTSTGLDPEKFSNAVDTLKHYGAEFDLEHELGSEKINISIAGQPNL